MALKFVHLTLPTLVLATIDVNIFGEINKDTSNVTVYVAGKDVGIITDTERYTFNMSNNNLKNAINSFFGKCPHDAYLRVPSQSEPDLYLVYGWKQVTRTLIPQDGKILKTSFKPVVVFHKFLQNNSSKPITVRIPILRPVYNKVSSAWITEGELSISQNIGYNINVTIDGNKSTIFLYNSSWGKNTKQSQAVKLLNIAPKITVLEPGQSVLTEFHATRGNIQFEIGYEAFLSGTTVAYYADLYKSKKFWPLDIVACMNSSGLSNQKISREVVNFEFYRDFNITTRWF